MSEATETKQAKPPTVQEMLAQILKNQADQAARLDALESGDSEPVVVVGERSYAKEAWAEEIWVEPLIDHTYPEPNDPLNYGIYRKAALGDRPADIFRLAHREHLNKHLRELKGDEIAAARTRLATAKPTVPQTAARNQKVNRTAV